MRTALLLMTKSCLSFKAHIPKTVYDSNDTKLVLYRTSRTISSTSMDFIVSNDWESLIEYEQLSATHPGDF